MPAGNADVRRFQPPPGHLLGHPDGLSDRFFGFIDAHDQAFMKAAGRGNSYPDNAQSLIVIKIGHDSADFGSPDINSANPCSFHFSPPWAFTPSRSGLYLNY
jgi:hypothetical protein